MSFFRYYLLKIGGDTTKIKGFIRHSEAVKDEQNPLTQELLDSVYTLEHPEQFLNNNGYNFIESSDVNQIAVAIIKEATL